MTALYKILFFFIFFPTILFSQWSVKVSKKDGTVNLVYQTNNEYVFIKENGEIFVNVDKEFDGVFDYNQYADSIFAWMGETSIEPGNVRKRLISDFIDSLLTVISWSDIEYLYDFAAHDLDASLINWTRRDTFDAEAIDHPSFAIDTGWTGDGSAAYITTNFNFAVDTVNLTNTDFMFATYCRTNDLTDNKALYGRNLGGNRTEGVIRTLNHQLRLHNTNTTYLNVNHSSNIQGCHFLSRQADTIYYQFNDNSEIKATKAVQTTTNGDIYILQSNGSNFSVNQLSFHMLLKHKSEAIKDDLFRIIEWYHDQKNIGVVE